jgi:uncharacterized membrane protein YbhN (UPF0104 family)
MRQTDAVAESEQTEGDDGAESAAASSDGGDGSNQAVDDASGTPRTSKTSPAGTSTGWRTWARLRLARRLLPVDTYAPIIGGVIFIAVAWVMVHELRDLPLADVAAYLSGFPLTNIGIAFALTALNFVVLSGYDTLAMRYVGVDLPYPRVAFSAFIGYAFSQAIGNPLITGGGVRYRLYSSWGLTTEQIAKTVLFAGVSFWIGCFALGSVLFLGQPVSLQALDLPIRPAWIGVACLIPAAGYVGVTTVRDRPLHIRGYSLSMPAQWMVPAQISIAIADLFVAASVLYVLLPSGADISYLYLLGVFQIALIAGVMSHVPGGLGVFDGILLMMLDPFLSISVLVGGILAFRVIFHILPLTLAATAYLWFETRQVKDLMAKD